MSRLTPAIQATVFVLASHGNWAAIVGYRGRVLIRSPSAPDWHQPETTAYENEAELRDMIARSPSLLPGVNERVAVATELVVPAVGKADVVAADPSGEITIVECKLAKNAEIRRWVIGQVFSYAAGLWQLEFEDLEQSFGARGVDLTAPFAGEPDWDETAFRDAITDNLANGAFRLVIAVDQITDELKRTVVYINGHTVHNLRLLALELRYAVDEDVEILIPQLYGEESAAQKRPSTDTKRQWDESSFLEELEARRGPDDARVARELIEWARVQLPRAAWGTGNITGSFFPVLDHAGQDYWPLSLRTDGGATIELRALGLRPPFDDEELRREFVRRLNETAGVSIPGDAISRRPSFRLALLASNPEALDSFKGALDWFCETVRTAAAT